MLIRSIRTRLIITLLLLTVGSLATLGTYILWYFHRSNVENLTAQLIMQTRITEELVSAYYLTPGSRSQLNEKIKEMRSQIGLRITVITAEGSVIADSYEPLDSLDNHRDRPEVIDALAGKTGSSIRYSNTMKENFIYTTVPITEQGKIVGVVRLASSLAPIEANFANVRSVLFAAFAITSLLAILISIRLAGKFTSPLEEITRVAQKMAEGHLDKRVHIRTGDEIELLAHTLNKLASSLDDTVSETLAEKRKLELILAHMDNAVILFDRYGRMETYNEMARTTFDITYSMLGMHNIQVIGNNAFDRALQESVTVRENRSIELKIELRGKKRVFQLALAPFTNESDVSGVLCVFHDITALQELHERQVDFVANASHELATPLTAIKGFAETLLDGALSDQDLSKKFLTIIHSEAERMQRLVSDLLQLAKLDSSEYRHHVYLEPVDLNLFIDTVAKELSPHWQHKELSLTIKVDNSIPLTVLANPDWLKQVLINLLDNAIKYTPAGGNVTICSQFSEGLAQVSITDTGIGIPASDLPLIFERFYRVEKARSRSAGGTGLGLAIVKFIVEALGGRIWVKSKVNSGTTFSFTLPLAEKK
ncbi:histidine kinase [Anaerosporomusa subterranea]|uniref:histidine kinase n=1 Tax=Anaerosporomusa subterranea TaxID=1794912 RepID=A0A154BWD7_ANASB|nr:ATP-binding protein [Anaerosporomusa subterranea]KYZ78256.1 histidine kinase [Anaerosporomusa subterranea]